MTDDEPAPWVAALAVAVILGVTMLAGCAAVPPAAPEVVKIPVRVPCVEVREIPRFPLVAPDAHLAQLDDYDLALTLAAEREDLFAWAIEAAAILNACAKPVTDPGS